MIALVGRRDTSVLYWLLKVAVPQIKGGRMVERGGWVCGISAYSCRKTSNSRWLEERFGGLLRKVFRRFRKGSWMV